MNKSSSSSSMNKSSSSSSSNKSSSSSSSNKSIEKSSKTIRAKDYYRDITSRTGSYKVDGNYHSDEEYVYYLNLKFEEDRQVISNFKKLKQIPPIKELCIDNVSREDKYVKGFLKEVAPAKLKGFIFRGKEKNKDYKLINVKYFLDETKLVLNATTLYAQFSHCNFFSNELKETFEAAKDVIELKFFNCKLDVGNGFKIDPYEYKLKLLWLEN